MIAMNKQLFQNHVTEGSKPVLVEFWAPWCVYCRRIAPALKVVVEKYADMLTAGQVNIDDEPQLAENERIEVIPTFVIYHNGEALGSIVAPESRARIEEFIQETLGV